MINNENISIDFDREMFLMQQTFATLFALSNKLQVKGDRYIDVLTSRQLMVMTSIAHLPEDETTINNIAKKLGTTKQSAKQVISIMEAKGYVTINQSPKDKRAVNIKITDRGKELGFKAAERGLLFFSDLFKEFDENEIETLWVLLKKLYRFDGEEQDGFEEIGHVEGEEEYQGEAEEVLKEFKRLRKKYRGEEFDEKHSKS